MLGFIDPPPPEYHLQCAIALSAIFASSANFCVLVFIGFFLYFTHNTNVSTYSGLSMVGVNIRCVYFVHFAHISGFFWVSDTPGSVSSLTVCLCVCWLSPFHFFRILLCCDLSASAFLPKSRRQLVGLWGTASPCLMRPIIQYAPVGPVLALFVSPLPANHLQL